MYHYKIVEVLSLRTLYHYGFAYVHELRLRTADHESAFEPADASGCVVDDVRLNYPHCDSLHEFVINLRWNDFTP